MCHKATEEGTCPPGGPGSATSTVPAVGCVDTGSAAGASPAQGSTAVSVLVQLHSLGTARASLSSPHHMFCSLLLSDPALL